MSYRTELHGLDPEPDDGLKELIESIDFAGEDDYVWMLTASDSRECRHEKSESGHMDFEEAGCVGYAGCKDCETMFIVITARLTDEIRRCIEYFYKGYLEGKNNGEKSSTDG